jgi:hypothetical protein
MEPYFIRENILYLLRRLSAHARAEGITLEIAFYGGSCLLLTYDYLDRNLTKDIDALFYPQEIGERLVRSITQEEDLPEEWLDGGVRQFLSPKGETYVSKLPELEKLANLKISFPTASYLIAMKIRAASRARFGYEGDLTDLKFLARKTNLKSLDEAQAHLEKFFDDEVIPIRAEEALQEVFDENQ